MEHVVKSFTLIDFLGIFSPGAVFVLAFQYYIGGATILFESFFGKNDAMLAVYFVALSYLCGNFLHHLGALAEKYFCKKNMHLQYWENDKVLAAYSSKIDSKLPRSDKEKAEAGKKIYHYIQRERRTQRLMTFSAFYTMSRSMAVTLILIIVLTLFARKGSTCQIILGCAFLTVLSVHRWREFEQKSVDEAYLLFLSEK